MNLDPELYNAAWLEPSSGPGHHLGGIVVREPRLLLGQPMRVIRPDAAAMRRRRRPATWRRTRRPIVDRARHLGFARWRPAWRRLAALAWPDTLA